LHDILLNSSDAGSSDAAADDQHEVVLDLLDDRDGSVTVGDLAETVALEQTDGSSLDVDLAGDVHENLVEEVLPELDDDDLLDFDGERGIVSTASESHVVARLLERVRQ